MIPSAAPAPRARVGRLNPTAEILRQRLGNICIEVVDYGEAVTRNGVRISLHPAGHVLVSAQARIEHGGEVWVASGDYKVERDGVSAPFIPLSCDVFITESTFGLPVYRWRPQALVMNEMNGGERTPSRDAPASSAAITSERRSAFWRISTKAWARSSAMGRSSRSMKSIGGAASRFLKRIEPPTSTNRRFRARSSSPRHRRSPLLGPSVSATIRTLSPVAGCKFAAIAVVAGSTAACPVRSCGLARPPRRHPRHRRIAHLGHPRRVQCADALSRRKWLRSLGARHGIWGRSARARGARCAGNRRVKDFANLYRELDAGTSTRRKQAALQSFLRAASANPGAHGSAAWTVYFLAGGKPRQFVSTRVMREVALDLCDLPEWLFEECRESVGDFAETLSLLLPPPQAPDEVSLADWVGCRLPSLRLMKDAQRAATLRGWIAVMPQEQRLVFFKLITGSLRVGVSKLNVVNALASVSGVNAKTMAQRMMGFIQTERGLRGEDFASLLNPAEDGWRSTQPYPFFLAHPLQAPIDALDELLGPPANWLVEWKFDGIRAQILRRGGGLAIVVARRRARQRRFSRACRRRGSAAERDGARRRNRRRSAAPRARCAGGRHRRHRSLRLATTASRPQSIERKDSA